jgi:hypothetical protein
LPNSIQRSVSPYSSATSTPTSSNSNTANPTPHHQPPCARVDSKQVFAGSRTNASYKRGCVVCRLEGRKVTTMTQYCADHKVSLCGSKYLFMFDSPVACPDNETCWDKFHYFYQPKFDFYVDGAMNRNSRVYKELYCRRDEYQTCNESSTINDFTRQVFERHAFSSSSQ